MLPTYLIEVRGHAPVQAGSITGLVALSSIAGSLLYGLLSRKLDETPIILGAAIMLILGAYPAFGKGFSEQFAIMSVTAVVFAAGILVAFTFAAVPRLVVDPARIGPANGVVAQIGSVGTFIGPPIVGYLVSSRGWTALPILIVLMATVFVGLALAANRGTMSPRRSVG